MNKSVYIDPSKRRDKIAKVWEMGFNTCHCALLLRDDLYQQIKMSTRELGFQYLRCHGVFSQQMGLYQEDEYGSPIYDFTNFDIVFDRIIACGLYPFFEISFMPEALKSGDTTICFYKANTSLPKSIQKWTELIQEVVTHAINRYGLECVKNWYFEVWNEPDLPFFNGTMEDYFQLYDHTVTAVKKISRDLRVGGPATSKCLWIDEFIQHIEKGSEVTGGQPVPCDFISTHAYPSDLPFLDSDRGDVKLQPSNIMYQMFRKVREQMDQSSLSTLPLFMGEWNSSAGPLSANHDERNNAAFIVKTLMELKDTIQGSLYWNLSDIYEECNFHYQPFHGGYGLLTVNSIPKSSYNAYRLLHMFEGEGLAVTHDGLPDGCGIEAAYDERQQVVNLLLYHYQEPDKESNPCWNAKIMLNSTGYKALPYTRSGITEETGSPYEWWLKAGSPDYLTLDTMQVIMEKSKLKIQHGIAWNTGEGFHQIEECLAPGEVILMELKLS